ncbi:hypothetical protein Zmor_027577 [Zophobas morio]|uniref:Dynein regulatory complex subunit 2 n=1 Tax=Zophobas morio TaxID=2755281 RepID=A0AA38HTR7_9CUCU|nr:hypothetical protein Zmor_027577 [Zophobas morio]
MPPKHRHRPTPEEKKQRKLEKKQRKLEQKLQLKRDHLSREVHYGEVTYRQYEKDWKAMLIKSTLPRMRAELEFAWHKFERAVDCKDFSISLLLDELRDSEEQYMHNFRAHAENMEELMGIFHDRLDELKVDFLSEVKAMEERCENEFTDINEVNNENMNYLKTMLYELEQQRKEHIRLKRGEYFSRVDEVDAKNQLLLQKLKANLENKYQTMFEDMKMFIRKYNKQIRERRKEHNALKAADDAIQEVIANQFKQLKRFYDMIRQLKQKYIDMKQTEGNVLLDTQEERQYFANSFLSLKIKLDSDTKADFSKLVLLSQSCSQVFEYLENLNKKGEMILSMASVCRKHETLKEKIQPFPCTKAAVKESDLDAESRQEFGVVRPEMDLFWQRLGKAYGTHYALSKERQFLTEENEILVETHNDYCEKILYPPPGGYISTVATPKVDLSKRKRLRFRPYLTWHLR